MNKKTKISVTISTNVVEKTRDFIYWNKPYSFAGLIEALLENFIKEIELVDPIKPRENELTPGRK